MPERLDALQNALRDRYAVERLLGEGGMASVYLARARSGWSDSAGRSRSRRG